LPDPTLVELLKQLPISVALLLVLLYFIRTNRQDRHELNQLSTVQANTEQLSAENQRRLIERSETFETTLSGLTARVTGQAAVLEELRSLNISLVAATKQSADLASQIRTRDEAKLQSKEDLEKFSGVVKEVAGPIMDGIKVHLGEKDLTLRKLETLHQTITEQSGSVKESIEQGFAAIPPHLDALKVKMDELPTIVKDAYAALVAERDAALQRATQAEQARDLFRVQAEQAAKEVLSRDEQIRVLNATIAALPKAPPAVATPSLDTATPPSSTPDAPPEGIPA
jgi:gas vesicle protein